MRIGIIGAGGIGHALAVRFAASRHQVMLSNSRGPATLADLVASVPGTFTRGPSRRGWTPGPWPRAGPCNPVAAEACG
jgi:3-hydroxyacyl-CoA dehydrogenase